MPTEALQSTFERVIAERLTELKAKREPYALTDNLHEQVLSTCWEQLRYNNRTCTPQARDCEEHDLQALLTATIERLARGYACIEQDRVVADRLNARWHAGDESVTARLNDLSDWHRFTKREDGSHRLGYAPTTAGETRELWDALAVTAWALSIRLHGERDWWDGLAVALHEARETVHRAALNTAPQARQGAQATQGAAA